LCDIKLGLQLSGCLWGSWFASAAYAPISQKVAAFDTVSPWKFDVAFRTQAGSKALIGVDRATALT